MGIYQENPLSSTKALRLLSFKDQFTHSRPLFKEIGVLNKYEINIFNILYLMFSRKFIYFKTKKEISAKEPLFEPFCKSKFTHLCINYCGAHLRNTIALSQNTDLEQSTTLILFKEKLKGTLMQI